MNVQQNIDRQEREFKELLQRIMQAPLSPITESVKEMDKRLDQFEQMFQDMRDIELSALSMGAEEARKQIRSLKTITEETPHEVRNAIEPLLAQLQAQLEQGTLQGIQQLVKELADQVERTARHADTKTSAINSDILQSKTEIQSSQLKAIEQLEHSNQSRLEQAQIEVGQMLGLLTEKLTHQSENEQKLFDGLQEMMTMHTKELKEQSASSLEQATKETTTQIVALVQSMAQLQVALTKQKHQLDILQEQQTASSSQLVDKVVRFTQPIRKWLIASFLLAGAGLAGVITLVAERF